MADNLTDIKNSVQNIQTNIDAIKQSVTNLDEIESRLKEVSKNTKPTGGIKEDTKKIKEGVFEVVSKLDALKAIESWTKNQNGSTGSTGNGVVGTIDSKIASLVNYQKDIHGFTDKISTHTEKISQQTELASEYLKALKEHIVDGSSTTQNSVTNNVTGGTGGNDIHSTVKDILKEIKAIRLDLASQQIKTGNDSLDEKLKKIAELEADEKLERAKLNEYYRKGTVDGKKLKGKEKRDFEKAERERQKEEQKRRDSVSGKRGGGAFIAKAADFAKSFISEKPSASKLADKGISAVSQANPAIGAILGLLKAAIELGSKQDRATSDYARLIGGGGLGKQNVGGTVTNIFKTGQGRGNWDNGYTAEAAYSALTEVAEARGRTTERMSQQAVRSAIDLKRMGIGAEAVNNFDTFGKSLEKTDEYFARLYSEVSKKGLSFKNVSKAVNDNLKMAQSHTFANGLRGLERMAEKSTQLKYNMQQVFQFADKVSEIEGAISTAANLSVLGGEFAQFSNPMQLLYEGLNDTEALNDRIIKMFGNKAYFNNKTGQMDMNAFERERLKQAAKGAGLDPNEMLNLSYNQGKMNRISSQIAPGVSKDVAEYIKNIAELDKKGNAYVNLNGKEVSVNKLTNKDKEMLEQESKAKEQKEGAKLGDVWRETKSIGEHLDDMLTYLQEKLGMWVYSLFLRWGRNEGNRRETAQGSTGDSRELREKRLNYYNEHANEHNTFWSFLGFGKSRFAKDVAGMSEKEIDDKIEEDKRRKQRQGESPNGLPIVSNIPGYGGFANGPSHWNGGVKATYRGQPWEIEGNEFLLNKLSSLKYRNLLPQLQNGTFNPYSYGNNLIKNDMEKYYRYQPVSPYSMNSLAQKNVQSTPNQVSGTIKVDIPQTITINIAGGGTVGNYDISEIISKYVDQFMKEMMMRKDFSGFNKEEFHNKSSVI